MMHALGERQVILEGSGHFIADNATVVGNVRLGDNVSVWFHAVLRADNDWIDIGANSNIQDGAVLHTDPGLTLRVGRNVTVGHQAMLHGCNIGDNNVIGIGSTILNGASIGNNCLVGAHALVTENKHFPDCSLIIGAPARVARTLSEEEITQLKRSADTYVSNASRYLVDFQA